MELEEKFRQIIGKTRIVSDCLEPGSKVVRRIKDLDIPTNDIETISLLYSRVVDGEDIESKGYEGIKSWTKVHEDHEAFAAHLVRGFVENRFENEDPMAVVYMSEMYDAARKFLTQKGDKYCRELATELDSGLHIEMYQRRLSGKEN